MRVHSLLLALLTTLAYSRAESDSAAYRSGDHSGGEYATVKAAQGARAGHSGGGGRGGGGVTFGAGGATGRGLGRGLQVSGVSTLDDFGNAVSAGTALGDSFQRGIAQVNARDRAITRAQELANQRSQQSSSGEARVARKDDQDRRNQLKDNAYNSQDQQSQGSQSHQSGSQDESYDRGSERGQKQIDVKDKHGTSLQSDGSYNRKDQAANAGNKALSANKNAFTSLSKNFADINYGFKRNFNNNVNERGGLKDSVGQDNTHSDVYEENQKDNRISRGFLDAFRRSNGNSAFRKESDWLSNAAQAQKLNNRFGAKDRLQNSANQNNADFNSRSDRRDDVFWHRDAAKDTSSRQANDQARKLADQQKSAEAQASGNKGVRDSKYYGGGNYAPGTGSGTGSGSGSGFDSFPITGHSGAGSQVGTAGNPYGNTGSGPVSSGGLAQGGNIVGRDLGSPGPVKGRQEGSGGAYLNQYGENARQSDNGGQKEASQAQSDAQALNNYNKGRGVDDSVQLKGQRRGQSSKDSSGRADKLSQAYNNANADASAKSGLSDKNLDLRQSSSNLDAANKNLQAQQVDRVNYKRNQVDTNQKVRKQKKFYHDKKEGGNNDEALNFNRNEGNQQAGEEQQAQKEARTSYNNAADDAKVNQQNRAYSNLDGRQISLADAFSRQKDQAGGWRQTNGQAQAQAQKSKAAADSGRQNTELDTFANNLSNRNQLLWASGQLNQARRERGSEKDRALDGFFQFGPVRSGNSLGLGSRRGSGGGQTFSSSFGSPQTFGQGSATFGSKRLPSSSQFGSGRLGGSKFGSSSGSSIGGSKLGGSSVGGSSVGGSQVGGSKFGGSSSSTGSGFSGSSFSSGFDSALGDFMDNMGSGKFGQFSYSQSPTGTQSASSSFPVSSGNSRVWNDKK